jgi:sugar lactone lactonase YvrE
VYRWWFALVAIAALLGAALWVRPSPVDPAAYRPGAKTELQGPLAPDNSLRETDFLGEDRLPGPEDVDLDSRGRIYCGLADGTIRRLGGVGGDEAIELFATTGGRPLGLDFDAGGTLWVADGSRGLLSVDPHGEVSVRATSADGVAFGLTDDVDVAGDGKVYFSDASWRFGAGQILWDALEARPHGRLLEHDPASRQTRVLLGDLYFANGVAVSRDGSFVLVAETFRYRVRRYWLRGPNAGSDEMFLDNLPGFPDGISGNGRGTFWLALYALRSDLLDRWAHPRPWLKRLLARLPESLLGGSSPYGLVIALDEDGRIVRSLHDPGGEKVRFVTSAEERGEHLYLGSVEGGVVGRLRIR